MISHMVRACGTIVLSSLALAQGPSWLDNFASNGTSAEVLHTLRFDDGSGLALFACGIFGSAGKSAASGVARWDGTRWSAVGTGLQLDGADDYIARLVALDLGSGSKLYALGHFSEVAGQPANGVAEWDGVQWSGLAGGPQLVTLDDADVLELACAAAFDAGSGLELYVGGLIANPWLTDEPYLARWNGSAWSMDSGSPTVQTPNCDPFLSQCTTGSIVELFTLDDGGGQALFAAGSFGMVGGIPGEVLAKRTQAGWQPLPGAGAGGIRGTARVAALHDPGSGPEIMLIGNFTNAPSSFTLRWDAQGFTQLAAEPQLYVTSLEVLPATQGFPGGLYATSLRSDNMGVYHFSRWDGAQWSGYSMQLGYLAYVNSLEAFDSGAGMELVFAGEYQTLPGAPEISNIARWTGSQFRGMYEGFPGRGLRKWFTAPAYVGALEVADMGNGLELFVGGRFTWSANTQLANLTRWTGSSWEYIPGLVLPYLTHIADLAGGDLGSGPRLWMAGDIKVANNNPEAYGSWDGVDMERIAGSDPGIAVELLEFAGQQSLVLTNRSSINISVDGQTTQYHGSVNQGAIHGVFVHDFGSGQQLSLFGSMRRMFSVGGGTFNDLNRIVSWDGSAWATVGAGLGDPVAFDEVVNDAISWDDGTGSKIYAGGFFATSAGVPMQSLAVWDGSAWSEVGGGVQGTVHRLATFDDGTGRGTALYVAGDFDSVGGSTPATNLARWDGTNWESAGLEVTGAGMSQPVRAMLAVGPPALPTRTLVIGGDFDSVGGIPSQRIAMLQAGELSGAPFCFGDGSGATCPCGNQGAPGAGCANSASGNGGLLRASGLASLGEDSLVFSGSDMPDAPVLYFQGLSQFAPMPFGDGLRCVGGGVVRLGAKLNVLGASEYPELGDASVSQQGGMLVGGTRYYQAYYRDASPLCLSGGFNVTNGIEVLWGL